MDAADPKRWFSSVTSRDFPFDCPITEKGREQAQAAARALGNSNPDGFALVVSSPFVRCVGTAGEVCRVLGLPLCIDAGLGEIFCPQYFGHWEKPGPPRRTYQEVSNMVPEGVQLVGHDSKDDGDGPPAQGWIGTSPSWPESLADGCQRFAARVEQYASRAARLGGAGFVLVSHADCIATCLSLALRSADLSFQTVRRVKYCGWAMLQRTLKGGEDGSHTRLNDTNVDWKVATGDIDLKAVCLLYEKDAEDTAAQCRGRTPTAIKSATTSRTNSLPSVNSLLDIATRTRTTDVIRDAINSGGEAASKEEEDYESFSDVTFGDLIPDYPPERKCSCDVDFEPYASEKDANRNKSEVWGEM